MFGNKKSIFPAYSGLSEIQVELPAPPSRASVQRDVGDLWETHTSQPHVSADEGPGIAAPYPDEDGFDPRGLSESNSANILVNRASASIDAKEKMKLLRNLEDLYTERLVSDISLSNLDIGALKEYALNECPGALLLYNGSNCDQLLKAFSLVKSFEQLVDKCVSDSHSPEDEKRKLLSLLQPQSCEAFRKAIIYPDYKIKQMMLGNTTANNSIDNCLHALGLDDSEVLPSDSEFVDHIEAIALHELNLNILCNLEISNGVVGDALDNCVLQVIGQLPAYEVQKALLATIDFCKSKALNSAKRDARKLSSKLEGAKEDLSQIDVPKSALAEIDSQIEGLEAVHTMIHKPSSVRLRKPNPRANRRSTQGLRESASILGDAQAELTKIRHRQRIRDPKDLVSLTAELYALACMEDCCSALMLGKQDMLGQCADNLLDALTQMLKESDIPHIKEINTNVEIANKDLQYAQKEKTMESLQRAESENRISRKKLQTLSTLIGS